MVVRDAEIEDLHDVRMLDARDDLVLLEKAIEQPAAARIRNVAEDLERDPLAAPSSASAR